MADANGASIRYGAARLTIQAIAGNIIVEGGTGGLDFTEVEGSGGNQVMTAAGSTNSVNLGGQDSIYNEGTDAITTSFGNVPAQIGGAVTVNEGQGNNQWSVLRSLHLTGHGGMPRFSLDAVASLSFDGAINVLAIQSSGGAESYDVALGRQARAGQHSRRHERWGGTETFFVDGRGGDTWSTIVNFHRGDSLTPWGFQPGTSTLPWTASGDTAGYIDATIHAELAGAGTGVNASATFAGLTMDDVQHLTTSTGKVGRVALVNVACTV